jgi:hypothetical protein
MGMNRDNNFTKQQQRGLDITFNHIMKKHPYIKGWRLIDNYEKYSAILYVDVLIDLKEMSKFFDVDIRSYYLRMYNESEYHEVSSGSPYLFFKVKGSDNDRLPDNFSQDNFFTVIRDYEKKLKNSINLAYQSLPEAFKIYYNSDNYYTFIIEISIDKFEQYQK